MSNTDEPRSGIENQWVIDSVSCDKEKRATLSMVESRPWGDVQVWEREIVAKANTYLTYIEQGLFADHPTLARVPPRVLFTCLEDPPIAVIDRLKKLREHFRKKGIEFIAANVVKKVKIEL